VGAGKEVRELMGHEEDFKPFMGGFAATKALRAKR
jgi:hypothetical protein